MAGREKDGFHTTAEESRRSAEAAFGGAPEGPVGVPGADDARRRRMRRLVVAFIAFDLVVAVIVGAVVLISSAVDDEEPSRPAFTVPSLPGVPSVPAVPEDPTPPAAPATPREPTRATGYFGTSGLRRGMATARRLAGPGARVELARITDDQIQVIARSGQRRKVVLVSAGFTRAIDTPAGSSTGNEFAFRSLNPRVASRLVRAIGRRYRVSERRIDYMVVLRDPISEKVQWLVYPRGSGAHYQADARGGSLRRVD